MAYSRTDARNFRTDLEAAMATLEAKYGCKLSVGRMTFGDDKMTASVTAMSATDADADAGFSGKELEWRKNFENYNYRHGLPQTALGKTFTSNGNTYTLLGYNPKAVKYPFLGKKIGTDSIYKFTSGTVVDQLKVEDEAVAGVTLDAKVVGGLSRFIKEQ
jgi:hypothetical protein